jgi:hypothetical protein
VDRGDEFDAHTHVARHAQNCAEWRQIKMWPTAAWRGRAGPAFLLGEPGVADRTTADSLAADRLAPQQDGQAGKSKHFPRSCLRIPVQSLQANAIPLIKETTAILTDSIDIVNNTARSLP